MPQQQYIQPQPVVGGAAGGTFPGIAPSSVTSTLIYNMSTVLAGVGLGGDIRASTINRTSPIASTGIDYRVTEHNVNNCQTFRSSQKNYYPMR